MKKAVKRTVWIVLAALLALLLFVFLNHRIRLGQEARAYPPIGTMVEVEGTKLHVYSEGAGPQTLVFLAGWSTSSPVWDFKGLYSRLSDQYRIVVIERAGYGYSESSKGSRAIDVVLEESRTALAAAGEKGPYILVPHSLAGLEAIYWAQRYPAEIRAVVGLDISFPETYEGMTEEMMRDAMNRQRRDSWVKNFGFIRLMPNLFEGHEPLDFDLLTAAEKLAYRAAVYRSYYTRDMINEGYAVLDNAILVDSLGAPAVTPMLLFIATEQGEGHLELSLRYLSQVDNGAYEILEGGHYIHDFQPEEIARRMQAFIHKEL